jgi:hypothetical protein
MKTHRNRVHRVGLTLALAAAALAPAAMAADFTSDFDIGQCRFEPTGRQNPYFSLDPGDRATFEGEEDGAAVRLEITVENETRTIAFKNPDGVTMSVQARLIVEREWHDGEVVEVSRNWFSRCRQTHDVFYFGESVDLFENGQVVSHEGSWLAGVNGAQPGIIIPARFLLGSRYFQEQAPGVALDRAEHVDMGLMVKAAGKTFRHCVEVSETSALSRGESTKVYCPGVGLVMDDELALTDFSRD